MSIDFYSTPGERSLNKKAARCPVAEGDTAPPAALLWNIRQQWFPCCGTDDLQGQPSPDKGHKIYSPIEFLLDFQPICSAGMTEYLQQKCTFSLNAGNQIQEKRRRRRFN
ncbi:hypothetical protein WMY93_018758 [Mugilogobius chulae]|uniref:Uncharacterized protein n=1 Tax=Mugilogobius chulae TaxID=88201 RepID=A0AAW0NX19_9GOBI